MLCVVRRPQLLRRTSPKVLAAFLPNLAEMMLIRAFLIIVQMVVVPCISRSHRLEIGFRDENCKNHLVQNHRPRNLIFGMKHHLVDLYQV